MKGWKTWLAAITAIGYGVGGYISGGIEANTMIEMIVAGLGLIGIGHKIEKAAGNRGPWG